MSYQGNLGQYYTVDELVTLLHDALDEFQAVVHHSDGDVMRFLGKTLDRQSARERTAVTLESIAASLAILAGPVEREEKARLERGR